MRIAEGKTEIEFWDIDDRGTHWLSTHSDERISTYVGEGYEVVTVQEQVSRAVGEK